MRKWNVVIWMAMIMSILSIILNVYLLVQGTKWRDGLLQEYGFTNMRHARMHLKYGDDLLIRNTLGRREYKKFLKEKE